ncbi:MULTISPECIES: hypothetical protein [Saccharothrix]|uniref:hypothetical protein n=1 Tax=Saccharothrix TaxID=2071 RepID=UPI001301045A|nr:hypothetical protein [Saccharothrix sp. CB00851]
MQNSSGIEDGEALRKLERELDAPGCTAAFVAQVGTELVTMESASDAAPSRKCSSR